MATKEEAQMAFHRKVQNKLADRYLDALEMKEEPRLFKIEPEYTGKRRREEPKGRFAGFTFVNILWLVVSLVVFHFTDFHKVLYYDPRINRFWFNIGAGLFSVTLSVALFLIVWQSFIKKKNPDNWEKDHPAAIPVATASFIIGFFCVTKGLWPVWGFLTLPILAALFMGFTVLVAMLG